MATATAMTVISWRSRGTRACQKRRTCERASTSVGGRVRASVALIGSASRSARWPPAGHDQAAFAGIDLEPGRPHDAAKLLDLRIAPAVRAERQLAGLEAHVLDRRTVVRPRRGGGLQHRLEIGVAGLAGKRTQRLRLAQHDGARITLHVGLNLWAWHQKSAIE